MLFRNFILVCTLIAMSGIAMLQVIENTQSRADEFRVQQRLEEWRKHDHRLQQRPQPCGKGEQICQADPRAFVA